MQGGCFSISSLGGIGGTMFTPIINAPEVAILGVYAVADFHGDVDDRDVLEVADVRNFDGSGAHSSERRMSPSNADR